MLENLLKYYRQAGISGEHFDCRHQNDCRSISTDFVPAREAFVGSEYEKGGDLPRLLFVSLNAGGEGPGREPANRTLQYARYVEEGSDPDCCQPEHLRKNSHWYWTHQLAYLLLSPLAVQKGLDSIQFRDIHKYFAHTNSAKCYDAARGSRQGHSLMFHNCREFIRREVELLQPDIVITQGVWARAALDTSFAVRRLQHPSTDCTCESATADGRSVLRLSMYHPRNGRFYQQKECTFPCFCRAVAEGFGRTQRGAS